MKLRELDRKEKMSRSVLPEHILTELNNAKGFVDDHLGNCGAGGSAVADSLSLDDFDDCYVPSSPLSATQELRVGVPPLIQQAPSSAVATRLANTGTPAAGRHFAGSQGGRSSNVRGTEIEKGKNCSPPPYYVLLDLMLRLSAQARSGQGGVRVVPNLRPERPTKPQSEP